MYQKMTFACVPSLIVYRPVIRADLHRNRGVRIVFVLLSVYCYGGYVIIYDVAIIHVQTRRHTEKSHTCSTSHAHAHTRTRARSLFSLAYLVGEQIGCT